MMMRKLSKLLLAMSTIALFHVTITAADSGNHNPHHHTSLSIPPAIAATTTPSNWEQQCENKIDTPSRKQMIPRGGGIWSSASSSWFNRLIGSPGSHKSALKIYQQSLQEQIRKLEQQLRTSKEEAAHLRKSLERLGSQHRKSLSTTAQLQKDQVAARDSERLEKELSLLEKQIKSLEGIMAELEQSLKEQTEKAEILQGKLDLAIKNESSLRSKYEQDMDALERRLLAESRKQLEALETRLEEQAQEAEGKLALLKKKHAAQLEQVRKETEEATTRKLEAAHAKEIAALQGKADASVEREKVKMRKLVKALAEREKKLFANTSAASTKSTSGSTTQKRKIMSSSTSSKRASTANVRTVK